MAGHTHSIKILKKFQFTIGAQSSLSIFAQKYLCKWRDNYFIIQKKYLCIWKDSFGAKINSDLLIALFFHFQSAIAMPHTKKKYIMGRKFAINTLASPSLLLIGCRIIKMRKYILKSKKTPKLEKLYWWNEKSSYPSLLYFRFFLFFRIYPILTEFNSKMIL